MLPDNKNYLNKRLQSSLFYNLFCLNVDVAYVLITMFSYLLQVMLEVAFWVKRLKMFPFMYWD